MLENNLNSSHWKICNYFLLIIAHREDMFKAINVASRALPVFRSIRMATLGNSFKLTVEFTYKHTIPTIASLVVEVASKWMLRCKNGIISSGNPKTRRKHSCCCNSIATATIFLRARWMDLLSPVEFFRQSRSVFFGKVSIIHRRFVFNFNKAAWFLNILTIHCFFLLSNSSTRIHFF